MKMRIDKERNIVRIIIRDSPIVDSDETSEGIILDFDENKQIVGLEFLNASEILGDLDVLDMSNGVKGHKKSRGAATTFEYEKSLV
jgi:uncharacterized protein YuzE